MSADVVTFGCRLNAYESEIIRKQAAAAGWKQLDDLRIAGTDHKHRYHRGRGYEQAQVNMAIERLEGLLGPIAGGGQSVGSQPNPGEKGDERQFVKDALVRKITGLADQDRLQSAAYVKVRHNATSPPIGRHAPQERLFKSGAPDTREHHGAEGSPFQMPTRLADGLGLESGLGALACAVRPIPELFVRGARFPRVRSQEIERT